MSSTVCVLGKSHTLKIATSANRGEVQGPRDRYKIVSRANVGDPCRPPPPPFYPVVSPVPAVSR